MDKDDLLLTVPQVAQELGVSPVQVTRYCRDGLLRYVEEGKAGRGVKRRIPATALQGFVRPRRGPKVKSQVE